MKLKMIVEGRAVDINVREFLEKLFEERDLFTKISDGDLISVGDYLFAVLNDCIVGEVLRREELHGDKLGRFKKDLGELLRKTVERLLKSE